TAGHARTLLSEADPVARARELIEGALTVRQAEQRSVKKKPGGKPLKDPNIADLEASISNRLGLKIQIIHKGDKGGEMRISYKSLEQLDELTRRMSKSGCGAGRRRRTQWSVGPLRATSATSCEERLAEGRQNRSVNGFE